MWNEIGMTIGGLLVGAGAWRGAYSLGVWSAKRELLKSVEDLEKDKEKHKELLDRMYNLLKEMEDDGKTKIF
tara:strand:- start:636 stop:851 length:216 start_codon:yes stop_codon:yes gene_type:complete